MVMPRSRSSGALSIESKLRNTILGLCFCNTLVMRSEEHTSELQSLRHLVCRLLLEKENDHASSSACASIGFSAASPGSHRPEAPVPRLPCWCAPFFFF